MRVRVGDEVLAPWGGRGYRYASVVVAIDGGVADLAFMDGDRGKAPLATLLPTCLGVGARIEANWKGKGRYYAGTITRRLGPAIFLKFDDGDADWTTVGQCRVRERGAVRVDQRVCTFCGVSNAAENWQCGSCGAALTHR